MLPKSPVGCNRKKKPRGLRWAETKLRDGCRVYSVIIRSAHSTNDTKIVGVPNFAPHCSKSVSVTPRAREQAPQEKIGICLATTFPRVSLSGGQPIGMIAFTVSLRIM